MQKLYIYKVDMLARRDLTDEKDKYFLDENIARDYFEKLLREIEKSPLLVPKSLKDFSKQEDTLISKAFYYYTDKNEKDSELNFLDLYRFEITT